LRDVGAELGVSEDAARMRVNRAVDRLRLALEVDGITVSTVLLVAAMSATIHAVPAGLGAAITATALAAVAAPAVAEATVVTAKWLSTKAFVGLICAGLIIGAGIYFLWDREVRRADQKQRSSFLGLTQNNRARDDAFAAIAAKEQNPAALSQATNPAAASASAQPLVKTAATAPTRVGVFAAMPESAIPGRYRWLQSGREKGTVILEPDHTFRNEKGEKFPVYEWYLEPNQLVVVWQRGPVYYTIIESPGVYVAPRPKNLQLERMEKLDQAEQ
jgi:hypothetical protein